MGKNLPYRVWFYFRQGWTTYFAFIFAAINTLTVTYYLAIENIPSLQNIFPNFFQYVLLVAIIGIPSLISIGYLHYKKTPAFKAEADIQIEANPHFRRILLNTELLLDSYFKTTQLLVKLSKNEKLSEDELKDLLTLQKDIVKHMDNRKIQND